MDIIAKYVHTFLQFAFVFSLSMSVWGLLHNLILDARGKSNGNLLVLIWAVILSYSIVHFMKF